jgi:hypothetical protein
MESLHAPTLRRTRSLEADAPRLHPASLLSVAAIAAALFFSTLSPILSIAAIAAGGVGLIGVVRQKKRYKGMVLCLLSLVLGVCLLVPSITHGVEPDTTARPLAVAQS